MVAKQPQRKAPFRRTLVVPRADVSTLEWLEAQDDHSASIRELIREYIKKHGYTDAANRPVRQLPRRGRPPGSGSKRRTDGDIVFDESIGAELYETDESQDVDGSDGSDDTDQDVEEVVEEPAAAPDEPVVPAKPKRQAKSKQQPKKRKPAPAPAPEDSEVQDVDDEDVIDDDQNTGDNDDTDDDADKHVSVLASLMGDQN